MKQSQLFTKTSKTAPSDEVSKNAILLSRAGYVYKVMPGVYAYTPLGLRVLENIKNIVREEMNVIGGQELIMTSIQKKDTWDKTGRWSDEAVDVWFKTKLKDETDIGLAWSHEEAILEMMQSFIDSYKSLPISVYQFQTKLRNELRAKSGIMRGREFIMKDMYSLHATQEDMDQYYDRVIEAYKKIFSRLGLGDKTFVTFASGGAFTKFSHEFQTVCDAGEDILYMNEAGTIAVNEEVLEDASKEIGANKEDLHKVKSAEVGNIFKFGTEKSEKMNIRFTNSEGEKKEVFLASYGIGITRVMGVIVEMFGDEKGIVWPEAVAPFSLHMVTLFKDKNEEAYKVSEQIYTKLKQAGVDVLWDDREGLGAGEKFADADLLGMPLRATVSQKSLLAGGVELKERKEKDNSKTEIISIEHLVVMYTKEC
jgi:prolyl-tRNA synthetase